EDYLEKYFGNADGILYKAEIGSTLTYQGEDPSSYTRSFTQQTRLNDADFAPLIEFMRFLDQADDATFERELPMYLDVDSFATYLAVNAVLVNTDSMIGMNNNYYLYYDEETKRFSVLMWDTNESLGKLGGNTNLDISLTNTGGGPGGRGGMPGGGGGMGRGQNALINRFLANATFKALYQEKLRAVYEVAFDNGTLTETVAHYSDLIHSVNEKREVVDIDAYDQAVQKVRDFISQRMEYLNTTELLSQ
ncbi:MAG TPA: CotH kinase family protein, partial [Anaerolineales bacterium]|nr:CotH kinase family protein [Anaerolineales bacterium]